MASRPTPIPRPVPPKVGIRRPVGRLASLKNPNPVPIRRPQSQVPQQQTQQQQQQQPIKTTAPPKTSTCPNPSCPAPNIVEDDGQKVCSGCGTVVSESNIVSEVTFGESSSGAAIVQGTFVGADQSHGRSFGPGFQRGGGVESREITEANGNRYIAQLTRALNIPESASKAGSQVFKLAVGLNFIQGRRTKTVAAVSLYIACRRQDGNTVMLIDFSDVLMVNVFKLGRAYKALLDELRLGGNHFIMNPIDPESLIYRFAKQLEFGPSMMQVASEAVRIVQRMNRDWMITGRRPAGICGAALILAARMNNFRRTVREVVYVVKVTEITIHQRLNEFKATESGGLTVDQFRSVQLESSHDPPAFTRSKNATKGVRGKKRKLPETAAEIEEEEEEEQGDTTTQDLPSPPKKPRRVDADGFAIPDLPIDPALFEAGKENGNAQQPTPPPNKSDNNENKKERSKGNQRNPAEQPTESELALESALEDEMTELLTSNSVLVTSANRPQPPTPTLNSDALEEPAPVVRKPVSDTPDIDPTEFENDPEVEYCLLSPAEVEIKERIWVHENKDYLRTQQAKALRKALAEANADPSRRNNRPRKKRKGRMGDVTYLNGEGGTGADGEASSRASTPAEATRLMLERRGFSKKINYNLLEKMYEDDTDKDKTEATIKRKESESDIGEPIRYRSRSRSVRSSSVVSERGVYGGSRLAKARSSKFSRTTPTPQVPSISVPTQPAKPTEPQHVAPISPPPTQPQPPAQQVPEPGPEPEPELPAEPTNPDEEILGYIPGIEPSAGTTMPLGEGDEDEDDDEEEEEEDEEDGVDDAFAGQYYDEGSEGGYDDDYY